MVEANEEKKVSEPQESANTPGQDEAKDDPNNLLEEVCNKIENSSQLYNGRLEAYRRLKEDLSKKLINICDTITKFQKEEQPKFKRMPVFLQDAQFYCDLTKPFMEELEKDIARHVSEFENFKTEKEAMLKLLLENFDVE